MQKETFHDELTVMLNIHNKDSEANTPDFLLAIYLEECLDTYIETKKNLDKWNAGTLKHPFSIETK